MAGKLSGNTPASFSAVATTCPDTAVWLTNLDPAPAEVAQCAEFLSADENLRAGRFRFADDQRRFIVARGRLRQLLAVYLSAEPAAIAFTYAENGKPSVDRFAGKIDFNVAHSGDLAIYAMSTRWHIGIDIESTASEVDHEALARRFFTANEHRTLLNIDEASRKRAFFACWTRKEAVVKATGDGLSMPFDRFEVTVAPDAEPRILASEVARIRKCSLYTLNVGSSHAAALAACGDRPLNTTDPHITE